MKEYIVISYDGDGIGRLINQYIASDDIYAAHQESQKISEGNDIFTAFAKKYGGNQIIGGGDQGVVLFDLSSDSDEFWQDLEQCRQDYLETTGATVTVGVGVKPSEANKSLLAGKLTGKDKIVQYSPEIDNFLMNTHSQVIGGEGDEESKKLDESYLSDMFEGDESEDGFEMQDGDTSEDDMDSEDDGQNYMVHEGDDPGEDDGENGLMPDESDEDSPQDQYGMDDGAEFEENDGIGEDVGQDYGSDEGAGGEEMQPESEDIMQAPEQGIENEDPVDIDSSELGKDNSLLESPEGENAAESEEWGGSEEDQPVQDPEMQGEGYESKQDQDSDQAPEDQNDVDGMVPAQDQAEANQADQGSDSDLMQAVAQNLEMFKQKKDMVEQLKQSDPEMYQAIIGLLQNMIALSQNMNQAMGKSESPK